MRAPLLTRARTPTAGRSILIVDDDRALREALRVVLELEQFAVLEAANGHEALELLAGQGPQRPFLILLDLQMPTMSGWEFLQAARREASLAAIPVIVASGMEAQAPRVKPPSVIGWIRKPYDFDMLVRLVRTHSCMPAGAELGERRRRRRAAQ